MDFGLAAEPVIGPRFARTRWRRPGMTGGEMPTVATSVDEAVAAIPDSAMVIVPREACGAPMETTRALIRRGVKRLHLVALPTSTMQADMLIGAGCVET